MQMSSPVPEVVLPAMIGVPAPIICLCLSEDEFHQVIDQWDLRDLAYEESQEEGGLQWTRGPGTASVHLIPEIARVRAILCIDDTGVQMDEVLGLIVHELCHVWGEVCGQSGERSPSSEFMAYSMQALFQSVYREYISRKAAALES
jgi:hypothetical protein